MTFYTYGHYTEGGRLFYIGKGQKGRCHSRANRNKHWRHIVAQSGLKVEIFARWQTEEDAFAHERLLISCLRDDLGLKLANCTDGGEGSSGFKPSLATRALISKRSSLAWSDAAYREKMKLRAVGGFSEAKLASSLKNAEKARLKLKCPVAKQEAASKNSEESKRMWADEKFKSAMKEKHKALWTEDRRSKMANSVAGRVRMSDGVVERNVLPTNVEVMLAQGWVRGRGPNSPSKRSDSNKS